jgi:hypothetical protein
VGRADKELAVAGRIRVDAHDVPRVLVRNNGGLGCLDRDRLDRAVRRFLRENSLTAFFLVIFLITLMAQSQASWRAYVDDQHGHDQPAESYGSYLVSPDFSAKVMENWQSEFLQFSLYILATIWLIQKGSSESKQEGEAGLQSDQEQQVGRHASAKSPRWAQIGGWRTILFSHSLLVAMTTIFFLSWFAQSLNGWDQYNADQQEHGQAEVAWTTYLHEPDFWDATLQNWQSEFLAVGTMAVFSVYLRQRGSPESKPVGAPLAETGAN